MRSSQVLPGGVLLLCWAASVDSANVYIRASANVTTSTSQTTSSTVSITSAPTSIPSGTQPVLTYTGDPDSLVYWCVSLYDAYLNASGTPSAETSTDTATLTYASNDIETSSYTYTITTTLVPTPYTPPPQCFQGCIIQADHARLEYWPTPRPNGTSTAEATPTITPPPIVTAIVDGKTLYSPSNYIVFETIYAENCPWDNSPCTTIGPVVNETTLSFGQYELYTENCFHEFDTFNYADFNTPIPWSIVSTQIGCTLITESHPGSAPDYDFTLNPNIRFPSEVRTAINPDWASCTFIDAAYDPPSALTPVQQLTVPPADPSSSPTNTIILTPTVPPAEPQSTPSNSAPTQTPDPPAQPTTTSVPPAPPASTPDPPVKSPSTPNLPTTLADPGTSAIVPPNDPGASTATPPADPALPTTAPVVPPAQSPSQGQPGGGSIGSIIASVGGINPPNPTPSSTITLPGQTPAPVLTTVGGQPVIVIPSSTLIPVASAPPGLTGDTTIINSTPFIIVPGPTTIAGVATTVGGILTTVPPIPITGAPSSLVTATIGGNTVTIAPDGGSAIVGGQTVTAGGSQITVSGTIISLGPSGIVVGSSTVAFATPTPGSGDGGASYSGFSVTTATPGGPIQASLGHKDWVAKGWAWSLALSAIFFRIGF